MKCPYCGYQESKVVDSRHSDDGLSIRRRRECLQCQKRFTTYETVESLPIVVIKRDSSRQQFDRNKILNGMLRACEKRPVPLAELERAADEIEQAIQNSLDREISTEKIGERQLHARAQQNSGRTLTPPPRVPRTRGGFLRSEKAPLPGELSAKLTERLSQICDCRLSPTALSFPLRGKR